MTIGGTGGFQTQVNVQPIMAVAGDFASLNPWFSVDVGPGGMVAGTGGVVIGRFAWAYPPDDPDGSPTTVLNNGYGAPTGFVHRQQQGLNPTYLSNAGTTIQAGFQMGLLNGGDFWVTNDGTAYAQVGQKAFAILATGKIQFAAAGTVIGGASATASSIAASTFSTTASIADEILTVTVLGSGNVYPGSTIAGTGVPTGTLVGQQLTPLLAGETANGVGRYYLLNVGELTVASETITGTYGTLTIGTATGTFAVGDILTGTNVVAGTAITANLTGTGGTGGTMVVNNNSVVSSTTITASVAVETKFYAMSAAAAGALIKISDHALG